MSVTITSTTDTPEVVAAAEGKTAQTKVEDTSAAIEKTAETIEASDASLEKQVKAEEKEETAEQKAERESVEKKAKKKGGFKKRIDKLNTRLTAAESETQYWRNEAMKSQKPPAEKTPETTVVAKADGRPDPEKFESHELYVEALADWKVDQKLGQREQKQKETTLKSDLDRQVATHVEKVQKFSKDHEDFNELIESIDDIPMSTTVQQVILESENGPELMYELAKSREEYERICKLPAIAAARELGKFEARIAKSSDFSKETKETKTTKAPKPISPVGSKASAASTKSPDEMDYQEFKKWREGQLKGA